MSRRMTDMAIRFAFPLDPKLLRNVSVGRLELLPLVLSHQLAGIEISAHLLALCWPGAYHS
jgi:hypothetical protein